MEIRTITMQTLHNELAGTDGNMALMFWSSMERSNMMAMYAFDDIAASYTGRLLFFKAGVMNGSSLSNMFGVQYTPSIVIIKDWKVVSFKSPIGAMWKEDALREIKKLLEDSGEITE